MTLLGLSDRPRLGLAAAVVANLLALSVLAYAAIIESTAPDFYYRSVQEDEYVEWASFWAFLVAGALFALGASGQRRTTGKLPWFLVGLGLFCLFVALEEISWGQGLIGYRPPVYFLRHNFQQELNLHNVVDTSVRMLAVKGVILRYGVFLPLASLIPALVRRLGHLSIVPPPAALLPLFLASYLTYTWYPWSFSGEWVEITLGLGFLFSALSCVRTYPLSRGSFLVSLNPAPLLGLGWLLVVCLGLANASWSRSLRHADPESIAAARLEARALANDFLEQEKAPLCGFEKRLYTYKEQYNKQFLLEGEFSRFTTRGLPQARAEFLLDPWNSPYWIQSGCESGEQGRVSIFVYSFGPNRLRNSTRWEIRDDDIGAYILTRPPAARALDASGFGEGAIEGSKP